MNVPKIIKKLLRWAFLFVLILSGILLISAFLIQTFISGFLQDYVHEELGWSLKIGSAQIQFHPLSVRLESIELSADNHKPFLQAKSVSASVPYSSFWSDEFLIQQMQVDSPRIDLELLPLRRTSKDKAEKEGKSFQIERASVHSGEIQFKIHQFKKINFESRIDSQGIRIKELKSEFNDISFSGKGNLGNWEKPEIDLSYEAHGDLVGVAALFPSVESLKGVVSVQGSAKGDIKHPIISGHAKSSNLVFEDSTPFSFAGQYKYDFKNELDPISVTGDFGSFPIEVLETYWKGMPQFSSLGSGTLQYSGGADLWKGKGNLAVVLEPKNNAKMPVSGQVNARLENSQLQIDRSNIQFINSQVTANGTLSRNKLSLNTTLQSSRLKDIAFLHPKLASIPGTFRVQAQLTGAYNNINAQGELSGQSGNSVIQAKGHTNLGTKRVSFEFSGNTNAEDLRTFLPDLKKGEAQFEGSLEGTFKKPILNASLNGNDLQFQKIRMQNFSGQVVTEGNRLQFHAEVPETGFQMEGSYLLNTREYEIRGSANGSSLEALLAMYDEPLIPIQGTLYTDFEATGNVRQWRESSGKIRLRFPELQWEEVSFSIPDTEIQLERGVAHLNVRAESPNVQVNVSGTATLLSDFPLDLQIDGKAKGELLEKISKDWKADGDVRLDATVLGTAARPKFEGKLFAENLNANFLPKEWKFLFQRAELSLSEHELNLEGNGNLNGSEFSWNGIIPLESGDGNLHFKISDLPVNTLRLGANVSGNISVAGDLQGKGTLLRELNKRDSILKAFHELSGNISVSPSNLKLGENDLVVDEPIVLTIQNQELHFAPARIRSGELLDFQGSGKLNLGTGRIESALHLAARIDLLSNLKADIQSSGPLTADLQLNGTLEKPEYKGTIQLQDASLRIPDSPLILEHVNLLASLDNERLRLDKLEARSGGGVITGGGELISGVQGSQVWVEGKNVATNYPEGLRSHLDFDLKLSAIESDVQLSGDVRILRSLYEEQLTYKNPLVRQLLAASRELTSEKHLKNRLKLALDIRTIDDLRLKNNAAVLRAGGNLKVGGSLYRPKFTGRLNIREGSRIFLSGNQYDVEKATVEFFGSESIEPDLDITLSSLVRDVETDTFYEVFIPFGGRPSQIEFKNIRSTPSLSQDQIFSLVTHGTVHSEQVGSRGVFQQQIISFFAGQTLGAPAAAIAKSIGLSRIKLQQEGLGSVNDPKTRLMLGKDIGAGFSLIYSFVLNDPDEQTWIATYRYGRNIIGRFIDQDDDTYTVSVSHKIAFGKGAKQSSVSTRSRKKVRGLRVTSIELKNNSPLTDQQIYKYLKIEVGDDYDYWDFQDHSDDLKKELQKMEYLYPVIDVRETESENNLVALAIEIHSGEFSKMIFNGYEVSGKMLNNYRRMWRAGISAVVVQQMIREDLLRQIQLDGYYNASVNTEIKRTEPYTIYHYDVIPGPRFTSVELQFHGTRYYDPMILQKELVRLYRSEEELFREAIHKPSDFSEKIKMLYLQMGYLRAEVKPGSVQFLAESGKITRAVQIEEGSASQIAAVTFSKGEPVPDSMRSELKLREGETFRPEGLLEDEQKIHDFYESKGYQDISVRYNMEFSNSTSNLVLNWALEMGPVARIASIRIEGNQSTRTDLILKQIGLKEGDLLTQESRSLARKRLSDLGVFQQTVLETEETEVPGSYDLVVHLVENKKYEFQYGGRYNTEDKFGAEIRLSDFNFLGRAQNLSLYLRTTLDRPLFRIDYTLPVTGSFWDRTRFSIFRDETDENVRATISGDLVKIPFDHRQLTFQFQQDHKLWNSYRLIYSFEYGSTTADFRDLATNVPLQFEGKEAVFRSAFLADTRDDVLNATRGYFYSVDGEFAPTLFGSDISYAKNFSQIFYYKKFGKFVLATGVRAGFLKLRSNILTIEEKFRTGGSTSLRGFEHNTVVPGDDLISIFFGGDSVFILNEEIRFPIYKWFSGAVFYDGGNVYLKASDFDPTNLRHSAGFGFRAGAGGFVLRFDFGFNLDPEDDESQTVFHFGIGQAF